jgi:hypothetical protein
MKSPTRQILNLMYKNENNFFFSLKISDQPKLSTYYLIGISKFQKYFFHKNLKQILTLRFLKKSKF